MSKIDKSTLSEAELRKIKRKKRQIISSIFASLLVLAVILGSVLPIVLIK